MKQPYLSAGRVINTHGFRGTVKLESYCDSPEVLSKLPALYFKRGDAFEEKRLLHASVFRQFVLADLEGITTEEAANALRGVEVFAKREDLPLPKGAHFVVDLIGLPVKHIDTGAVLGSILDVETRAGRELYKVETPDGVFYLPAVKEFVKRVDLDEGVFVDPIPGLLDQGGERV
ncbi:MAG: 16S rRNA processing protein RimM [Clostridia bacterium]|nr:16S rRNA processing protein RimM [Clostridia bacterium]